MYWQFWIKAVHDNLMRPSPPQIAIHSITLGLKQLLESQLFVFQEKSQAKVLTGTLRCEWWWTTIIVIQCFSECVRLEKSQFLRYSLSQYHIHILNICGPLEIDQWLLWAFFSCPRDDPWATNGQSEEWGRSETRCAHNSAMEVMCLHSSQGIGDLLSSLSKGPSNFKPQFL